MKLIASLEGRYRVVVTEWAPAIDDAETGFDLGKLKERAESSDH